MQRHKPPISAWIASERKRHGWKVSDLSKKLTEAGYDAQPPTIQVWEAGRKPRDETVDALERLFGSAAPRDVQVPADMATLLAKMDRQTDAIEAVAKALLELIVRMDRDQRGARAQREQIAELLGSVAATIPEGTPDVSERRHRRRVQE